jgi:hypothetical protein
MQVQGVLPPRALPPAAERAGAVHPIRGIGAVHVLT